MSQRAARSTRAQQPVYADAIVACGRAAAAESDDDDDDASMTDAPARATSSSGTRTTLGHQRPLTSEEASTPVRLREHTANLLLWREDQAGKEDEPREAAQLDTSCLASVLSTLPGWVVRALYAVELEDEAALGEVASTINNFLRYSDGGLELDNLIRVVRAWSEVARAGPGANGSAEEGDFWSALRLASIAPRNLVTFCFLLMTRARSLVAFQAATLYTSLLELACLSGSGSLLANELTLRAAQSLVRSWARQDARNKEAGCTSKKARGKKSAAAAADPFAEDAQADSQDDAWMAAPEATLYVADFMTSCVALYSASAAAQPLLLLFKYTELLSHLTDTLIDVTRTDVEAGRRARESVSPVATQAFDTLLALLHPAHGTVTTTFQSLLKHALLSAVVAFGGGASSATLPKHLLPIHRGAIVFVRRLMAHVRDRSLVEPGAVHLAVYHFLQHLLLRASDRADYRRTIAVASVRDLLVPLDGAASDGFPALRAAFVGFVGRMVCNKRAGVRLMGLEVVEAALQQTWSLEAPSSQANPASSAFAKKITEAAAESEAEEEKTPSRGRPSLQPGASIDLSNSMMLDASFEVDSDEDLPHAATLMALLLRRCSDASPVVRAKALAALAHVLSFCATTYGPTATPARRAAFCRVMRERMSVSSTGAASAHATPAKRSLSAPMQAAALTPQSNSFSFLHTPLSTRSRSEFRTPSVTLNLPLLAGSAFHPSLPGVRDMLEVLYRRAGDEKAVVRRAAIQALECILVGAAAEDEAARAQAEVDATAAGADVVMGTPGAPSFASCNTTFSVLSSLTASDLQIFFDGCLDRSLSIRKQSMISLSALLKQFASSDSANMPMEARHARSNLSKIWLGAVLPLVQDREKSVVDKCVEVVFDLMVDPLARALSARHAKKKAAAPSSDDAHVWSLFEMMDAEMLHYFSSVFILLLKSGQISNDFVKHLIKDAEETCGAVEAPVDAAASSSSVTIAARSRATWVLLEVICHFSSTMPSIDLTRPISAAWTRVTEHGWQVEESTLLRLLSCVGHLSHAGRWSAERLVEYAGYLFHTLTEQVGASCKKAAATATTTSPETIKKQIWILNSLCAALAKQQETDKKASALQMPAWEAALLVTCEKQLEAYMATASSLSASAGASLSSTAAWNEAGLTVVLFTLGELILQHQTYSPKTTVSPALLTLVQTFIAPTMHLQKKKGKYAKASAAPAAAADVDMEDSSQSSLSLSPATGSFKADMLTLSASLRAHAFLTLGKFCLRHEQLAKRCIMLFVSELEAPASDASPLVQNNVLLVLCDLCRTFTAIVDPYLHSITAMLCSRNTLLRKHTIMVLNVLLQEEYLKMKSSAHVVAGRVKDEDASVNAQYSGSSSMFYRYLRCLVDEDAGIRQLVQVSLKAILSKSTGSGAAGAAGGIQATRIHMHFVELIFFLNQCHEHPLYNQFGASAATAKAKAKSPSKAGSTSKDAPFGLVGALGTPNAQKRFTLYRYCLSLLTDEQKFILMGKLHSEVLQAVNEESFLTAPWHTGLRTSDVVQDALIILACDAMQLGGAASKRGADASAEAVEGELAELALAAEEGAAEGAPKNAAGLASLHAQQAAKAKLLHKLLKKSTMDACLPILFELRTSFAQAHSPLNQWLQFYFAELLQHYKTEMGEVFAGNKMLEREVLYDLKRWQDQEAQQDHQAKWRQLDFTPKQPKRIDPITPSSLLAGVGVSFAVPDSVSRRLSLGAALQQGTPMKMSSLSALRVGSSPMQPAGTASFQSPVLRRTFSTPSTAANPNNVSVVQATPSTLRTPGYIATPLLRRTHSTPSSGVASSHSKPRRRSAGPVPPARLAEGVEEGSDVATDVESDSDDAPGNLIVMPSLAPGESETTPGGPWKVALPGVVSAEDDPDAADLKSHAQKKARTTRAIPPASALEQLTLSNKPTAKRKAAAVKQEEEEKAQPSPAAAGRPKRKAAGR